jgi:hypothetical protein
MSYFSPTPPHVHIDFVVPPPGCGRSVTDFWGWGTHRARLRCPDDVSGDDMCERGVPGGALNLSSTSYPDHGRCGENSHGRTGNRTRDLMVSSQKLWPPSYEAGHLTCHIKSSHLRMNSINFSSICEDKSKQHSLQAHSKCSGGNIRMFTLKESKRYRQVGPIPSRQTFSLSNGDGTELRRDGDVPVSVNISV